MRSGIYTGRVIHERYRPKPHRLDYRVYSLLLDLDELDQIDAESRFFSVDRFNLMSFRRRDHGPRDGSDLRKWAWQLLSDAGVDADPGPIQLLVYPRILGYGFDPITVWYCHDSCGTLVGVIHEVRNTFGEHHSYVVPIVTSTETIEHSTEKMFHVSPFFDVVGRYDFTLSPPRRSVSVRIDYSDDTGLLLRAGFSGVRSEFTDSGLLARFWSHPLVSLKVIAGIHWEAVKLTRLRVGYRKKPKPPPNAITHVPIDQGIRR